MRVLHWPPLSRRAFLGTGATLAVAALTPRGAAGADGTRDFRLIAGPAKTHLAGRSSPETSVWAYDGSVPGPLIRARQGERLRITVENRLKQDTTVHWHGLRIPNPMDGVPDLTQKPIAPGGSFVYEFDLPDAGTFWYHPHQRSAEQVDRGLHGPLIVDEREPIAVDRDLVWVLDDWRLQPSAQISADFANPMDMSHAGRIGNTVTVNGRQAEALAVRSGERIRLRLINVANARIFALTFTGHRPRIIALDGQPVAPHEPPDGRIVLGPAMRADLVLDCTERPGARLGVTDTFYGDDEYRLLDLVYDQAPLRARIPDTPIALPANPLAEPDLAAAERHTITLGGGMMGGMMSATMNGRAVDMREMMRRGAAWALNGVVGMDHAMAPLLELGRGRSYILTLDNTTAWHHPIHLHGHSFRVLSVDGKPTAHRQWLDTVLLAPQEQAEIAFVADNPGAWMFHCHILEHQAGGMMGVIRVS